MTLLLPGLYVAADSVVHRLDPRVKMGASLLLTILPFATQRPVSLLILAAFVVGTAILSKVPLRALLSTLRTVFWLGFIMFFFYLFTTPGRALLTWGPITVSWEGLLAGGLQIYRICLLVVVGSLLTFTTSSSQLTHGLESVLWPFDRIGLPVRELAMVLTIALRFVPTLFEEIDKIVKAQRARGADPYAGPPWQRVRSWVPVFVPIFVSAFRRAEELATAMEARGFRGVQHRTRMMELRFTYRDLIAALATVALAMVVLYKG
ncbi:MAG: energy-coupling factor transporter transmembrane component T [Anaerolineae bacterium]|jgi:energy-coupling factor transport system permease protein